ncbi:MAG: hypothetical protein H0W84_09180, partial [Bacteroidetes bacterium]|nr:hypothetical protein [Bacteroidota bacterium]
MKKSKNAKVVLEYFLASLFLFAINCEAQTLVFKNGFEGTTHIQYKNTQHEDLLGYDNASTPSDWVN